MKRSILAVHDVISGVYGNPFFSINKNVGIRDFHFAAQDMSTSIGQSPDDYSLYYLGEFDDVLGTFELVNPMQKIARASAHLSKE